MMLTIKSTNNKRIFLLLVVAITTGFVSAQKKTLPYKDAALPVEARVQDLLSRMTLKEKVGQLLCPLGWEMYVIQGNRVQPSDKFKQLIKDRNAGMLWATYRADPWTKKTLANGLTPALAAKAGNALQKYVIENTRLGIPLFLAEEAPHGHMAIGTTVFPTGIGMAATWSPDLLQKAGRIIGEEIRSQGAHISYGPVLDLTRDPRWSRVEETFGEDPVLSGILGASMVQGLTNGGDLSLPHSTVATLKHFLAYAVPESGQNGNQAVVGMRELHESFLPPFQRAIDAGALSVMTSYNSIDGIPCTANSYLLTELLRNEWQFKGFVVSDLYSIEGIHENHYVASSVDEAAVQALTAGVDIDLGGDAYIKLCQAVEDHRIAEVAIDTAVRRVLQLKFAMGLFENPYVDSQKAVESVRNAAHIDCARQMAQASVTLLKNKASILPLDKNIRKVAVVGPNADNRYNMLGDYTAPQEDKNVKTVLDGVVSKLTSSKVEYVRGCAIRDTTMNEINEAVAAALRSDVVIAVVGGSSARDFKTTYKETGAAVTDKEQLSDMECGEGFDRASLSLLGRQQELLEALQKTGKPLIVIYIEGRPLNKNWAAEHANALLTAYYPGQEGGLAIADVLFGDYNPAGRLPISTPRSVGQLPVHYNKKAPLVHNYVEMPATPLYSFGYGLSYTTFEYADLRIVSKENDTKEVSFNITNTGKYDGEEVAQLYLRDEFASVVQPLKQLKQFKRLFLKRGETKSVRFTLTKEDFMIIDRNFKRVVEPGSFQVMVGASSDDIKLTTQILYP
ncbi:glycoside hydrolase family 3 N-terminal domain-containing protein [Bacteroides reticulotermitis]|uniref:glycoside hydrolase family 3 N-terminal domain-containing protein n=1 Tax=Bacteroides reticulotermitis TaxID=1133319 RepID=UPI003A87B969